jgi:hypothetical protein
MFTIAPGHASRCRDRHRSPRVRARRDAGKITAIEFDPSLAQRASRNFSGAENVFKVMEASFPSRLLTSFTSMQVLLAQPIYGLIA